MENHLGVSVIICCFNSSGRIIPTLNHIKNQITHNDIKWEVILVDNASTDDTSRIANETWADHYIPLKIVTQPIAGLSYAREKGIETAIYDYLLFCDDDNWLCENYIQDTFEIMQKDSMIAALGGYGLPEFESEPPNFILEASGPYAVGPQASENGYIGPNYTLYGAGTTYRRSAMHHLKSKGFEFHLTGRLGNKLTTGEDRELGYVLTLAGYKQYYSENLTFKHFIPSNRLTSLYYNNLLIGNCYSFTVLNAYYTLVQEKIFNRNKIKSSFIWSFLSFQFLQIKYLIRKSFTNTFLFELKTWLITSKEFIKNRSIYEKIILQARQRNYYE